MNSYDAEYKKKLTSPETAADLIGSGDTIVVGMSNAEPPALLAAIAARVRADAVKGLEVYTMSPMAHLANTLFAPDLCDCIQVYSWFVGPPQRGLIKTGIDYYIPNYFHQVPRLCSEFMQIDATVCVVSPMDKAGYFSFGLGERLHLHGDSAQPEAHRRGEPEHAPGIRRLAAACLGGRCHRGKHRTPPGGHPGRTQAGRRRHRKTDYRDDPRRRHDPTGGRGDPQHRGGIPLGTQGPRHPHGSILPGHGRLDREGRGEREQKDHSSPERASLPLRGAPRRSSIFWTTTPPWKATPSPTSTIPPSSP